MMRNRREMKWKRVKGIGREEIEEGDEGMKVNKRKEKRNIRF